MAKHLLQRCPDITYTAYDFSQVMHRLSKTRLVPDELQRVNYITGDFKQPDWADHLPKYDMVIIHQALHELRHKAYATDFHKTVRSSLLRVGASYLVCDHLYAEGAMTNNELYMSEQEHLASLQQAGFTEIKIAMQIKGLCVFNCH